MLPCQDETEPPLAGVLRAYAHHSRARLKAFVALSYMGMGAWYAKGTHAVLLAGRSCKTP